MMRLPLFSLAFVFLICSCSSYESKIKGKWKLVKALDSQKLQIEDELKDLTYIFQDQNRYSKQGISKAGGEDKLITATGEWRINKVKDQDSKEHLYLLLREEKLEGILEMKFQIDTIGKNELVWSDNRKNKFYFSKISE